MALSLAYRDLSTIKETQEIALQKALQYLALHSPFYKKLFHKNQINVQEIKKIEDLKKLPLTTKEDLQKYNDDFICVPKHKIIDYVTTSGTLGDPVTFALTDNDLDRLALNESLSFECAGINKNDILQLMTTLDRRFMAGMAYFLGARKLRAGIIRVGSGIPELQWDSIFKFKPTFLICVPSFLLKLIEYAAHNHININTTSIKGAICIGEPIRNQDFTLNNLGKKITGSWKIELYSTYASTEMNTAFTECKKQQGGHLLPELIIPEILDEKNNPVAENEVGELVITTLGIEAMPLLRFKTGDMVKAHFQPCACGRNSLRIGPVVGRKKQMIKYKGTTLYPPAMFNILNHFKEIEDYIIELFHNDIGTDEILLKVGTTNPSEELKHQIKDHFRAKLRVAPTVEFTDLATIKKIKFPKMSRKPLTLIDKRI